VKRAGLSFRVRNEVLALCGEEIAHRVLSDNRDQALSLSLEQRRSRVDADRFCDLMQAIDERGLVRRGEDPFPTHEELHERRARYLGLTRPELSLVTALTKINLSRRLEDAPLVDDEYLVGRFLKPYFPPSIVQRFPDEIAHHRLRRDLVATRLVNELVDVMGSTFIFSMVRDEGVQAQTAIRAWIIAADILDLRSRAENLRAHAELMNAEAEVDAFLALARATTGASQWALHQSRPEVAIGSAVETFRPLFQSLSAEFETMLVGAERDRFERIYRELRAKVNEEALAHELARLAFADHLLSVIALSFQHGGVIERAAPAYFALSAAIDFATLETALTNISSEDHWERRASRELAGELGQARVKLTEHLLISDATEPLEEYLKRERPRQFDDAMSLIAELKSAPSISLAALQVIVRAISRLAAP
jgi:glutamate dehydrogenase